MNYSLSRQQQSQLKLSGSFIAAEVARIDLGAEAEATYVFSPSPPVLGFLLFPFSPLPPSYVTGWSAIHSLLFLTNKCNKWRIQEAISAGMGSWIRHWLHV